MKISILTIDHFITGSWSGGSTTQLYIHPPDATYIDRNFKLRISTATIKVEESTFTALPSIDRKLMVLEGEIVISHKGRYTKRLMPYEVDTFSGDWETKSVGTCTDFNVMTTGQIDSELYHISIDSDDAYNLNLKKACIKLFLYSPATNHGLQIAGKTYHLDRGTLLLIDEINTSCISMKCRENIELVVVEIFSR